MKEALLRPLLKKLNPDLHQNKNFRPVSNLLFVSTLVERVVCDQLLEHAMKTGKPKDLQSVYRSGHSTETALLKVKTDILDAMDKQRVMCLVLLDLSAVFDTVLHDLLLNWLKFWFSITSSALSRIKFYHTQRSQKVVIDDLEPGHAPGVSPWANSVHPFHESPGKLGQITWYIVSQEC